MRLFTLAFVALTAATLQPVTSSNAEASSPSSVESVAGEGGGGWGIFKPLLDKSSQALHEGLDWLSASAHKLYDGLHLVDVEESLWDKIIELGPRLNADGLFYHAMELYPSEKIAEFKASVQDVITTTNMIQQVVLGAAEKRSISPDSLKEELGGVFNVMFEELKEQFPPPEKAPSHESRMVMVNTVLDRIEGSFLRFTIKHGFSEEPLKSHTSFLKLRLQSIVVTIGDLVEQHPELAVTLLCGAIIMLLPEFWIVRQLLRVVGFNSLGPTKGGLAAWLQGWLFGPAVPKGGWFAILQRLAMKAVIP